MSVAQEVAAAYVTIYPKAPGAQAAIAKQLGGDKVGEQAGRSIGSGLLSGLKKYAGPIAALVAGLSVRKVVKDSMAAFADLMATTNAMQRVMGGSKEQVSAMSAAVRLSGVDADKAKTSFTIFAKNLGNAAGDSKKTAEMTRKLGVSFLDASGNVKPMADILPGLADKFAAMPDGAEKTALACQLFGRSGADMLPFLNKGSEGIGELTVQAAKMGLVVDETSGKIFSAARTSMREWAMSVEGLRAQLGQNLTPIVTAASNVFRSLFIPVIQAVSGWLWENRDRFVAVGEKIQDFADKVRGAVTTVIGILTTGNYEGNALFDEDSPLVGGLYKLRALLVEVIVPAVRTGMDAMKRAFHNLGGTDGAGQLVATLAAVASAFSPLGLAIKALQPVMPELADAFTKVAGALADGLGKAVEAILPILPDLVEVLAGTLADAVVTLAPAIGDLAGALGDALASVVPVAVDVLVALADALAAIAPTLAEIVPLLADMIVAAIDLVTPILRSEDAVKALLGAFLLWKTVGIVGALITQIRTLYTSTAAWGKETAAAATNRLAKLKSMSTTAALAAMYAGEWIKQQTLSLIGWGREKAAIVAHKVATIASTVATKAMAAGTKIAAVAQRAFNLAMSMNPIGLVVTAIGALVTGLVLFFTKTKAGKKIIEVVWGAIKTAISAVSDWFTETLWPAIKKVLDWLGDAFNVYKDAVTTVWDAVKGAIDTVWSFIRDKIFVPIEIYIGILKTAFNLYKDAVTKAWDLLKSGIRKVWDWIRDKIFVPIEIYIGILKTAFNLYKDAVTKAWDLIKSGIKTVWDWIRDNVFDKMKTALDTLKGAFDTAKDKITRAWDLIKSGIKTGWDWIRVNVFDKMETGVDKVKEAFETAKDGIGEAWDKLQDLVKAPIKFVIETVYNKGIVKWWNRVADKIAPDLTLKEMALPKGFAQGTEDHRAQIARGGAWRVWAEPETGGEAYIPLAAAKRARSTSILEQVAHRFGYRLESFAGGGIIGWAKDRWNDTKKIAGTVAAILKDPAKAIKEGIDKIADTAFGSSGLADNTLLEMVKKFPGKIAQGLIDKVKGVVGNLDPETATGAAGPAGTGAPAGTGVAAQTAALRALDPTARVSSGFRPGAITAVGTKSYHGRGRAIDIVSPNMGRTFDMIHAAYGARSPELLYTPKAMLLYGRPYNAAPITRKTHYDHIHWAFGKGGIVGAIYDQGGWMPPGTAGINLSGRPEAVLTPDQTTALKAGLTGPKYLVVKDVNNELIGRVRVEAGKVATGQITPTTEGRPRW